AGLEPIETAVLQAAGVQSFADVHSLVQNFPSISKAGVRVPLLSTEILQMNPKPASMFAFPGPLARQTRGADRSQHLGNPNAWSRVLSGHFPWHLDALLLSVALECMTHASAGGGCGRSSAISRRISWNICRGMATSAIRKTT